MTKEAYLISTCDEWKSKDSMRVIGFFDSELTLKNAIITLFEQDYLEWDGKELNGLSSEELEDIKQEIKDSSPQDIDSKVTFIDVEVYYINELYI